MTSVSVFRE